MPFTRPELRSTFIESITCGGDGREKGEARCDGGDGGDGREKGEARCDGGDGGDGREMWQ
jgi:hypothetical protein